MNFVADVDESHLYHPPVDKNNEIHDQTKNRQQLWSHFEMKMEFSYCCGLGHVDFLGGWLAAT
jgi:hypothetical protein